MSHSQNFLILGLALVVAELFVGSFFLLPVGIGFLLTGICGWFLDFETLGAGVYALAAFNLSWTFILTRFWIARRRRDGTPGLKSAAEALIGQVGRVEQEINPLKATGYVRVYGDSWQAKWADQSAEVIPVGESVEIVAIEGNQVKVRRRK